MAIPIPLIMSGLSLLPKIPKMWKSVAGLFGKKVPSGVEEAGDLASEVMDAFTKGQISEETQLELEKIVKQHELELAKLALEEKELYFKDLADIRDLEKQSYKSEDPYVRQTRPKILRHFFKLCAAYALYTPLVIIALSYTGMAVATMTSVISMIEWIGGWLFGTFGTAYLGYSAARTVDKKNPNFKDGTNLVSKIVKGIVK